MDTTSTSNQAGLANQASYQPSLGWIAREAIDVEGALQNLGELSALLRIITAHQVQTVLEIGTWAGGSAWAWAHVPTVRHIITVDNYPQPPAAARLAGLRCRVTPVTGNSSEQATVAQVVAALDSYRPDMVFIDGGHEYETCKRDYDLYAPLVNPGGLVVLHDTQGYPGNDTVQVPRLWSIIREQSVTTELIDVPGGPGGTGIVWC